MSDPRYIRTKAVAARTGMSESLINQLRCRGGGPPFIKVSSTVVLYDVEELDKWLAVRTVQSTAEAARLPIGGASHAA
jgi:predicted DNA-binding transcriptional regulator AlpA